MKSGNLQRHGPLFLETLLTRWYMDGVVPPKLAGGSAMKKTSTLAALLGGIMMTTDALAAGTLPKPLGAAGVENRRQLLAPQDRPS